jgi:hypothetical protein
VPGSYKAWLRTRQDLDRMVDLLADTAAALAVLHRATGRDICLGLEPEPDCFLENTAECVAFFKQRLPTRGCERLTASLGITPARANELLRRHVGLCFDTCHLALQYEDILSSLETLTAAGIRIAKLQISAAIEADGTPAARDRLASFCDPVYLHQVKTPGPSGARSRGDLDMLLAHPPAAPEPWRIHCHVPLDWPGDGTLRSTAEQLTPAFFRQARALGVTHFEIETYTRGVLPSPLRGDSVATGIAREFLWLRERGLA